MFLKLLLLNMSIVKKRLFNIYKIYKFINKFNDISKYLCFNMLRWKINFFHVQKFRKNLENEKDFIKNNF